MPNSITGQNINGQQNFGSIEKIICTRNWGDLSVNVEKQDELGLLRDFLQFDREKFSFIHPESTEDVFLDAGSQKYKIKNDSTQTPIKKAFEELRNHILGQKS